MTPQDACALITRVIDQGEKAACGRRLDRGDVTMLSDEIGKGLAEASAIGLFGAECAIAIHACYELALAQAIGSEEQQRQWQMVVGVMLPIARRQLGVALKERETPLEGDRRR